MKKISLLFSMMLATALTQAATLLELQEKASDLEAAELAQKISKAKDVSPTSISPVAGNSGVSTNTSTPVVKTSKADQDIRLVGIYGLGEKLYAEININGISVPLLPGDNAFGWLVKEINRYEVNMVRLDKKGKPTKKTYTARFQSLGNASDANPLPSVPPGMNGMSIPGIPSMMPAGR